MNFDETNILRRFEATATEGAELPFGTPNRRLSKVTIMSLTSMYQSTCSIF